MIRVLREGSADRAWRASPQVRVIRVENPAASRAKGVRDRDPVPSIRRRSGDVGGR
jgi:hypothetical protein